MSEENTETEKPKMRIQVSPQQFEKIKDELKQGFDLNKAKIDMAKKFDDNKFLDAESREELSDLVSEKVNEAERILKRQNKGESNESETANVYSPQQQGIEAPTKTISQDIPVSLWASDDVKELMQAVLQQAQDSSNPERQREAIEIYNQLAKKEMRKGGNYELEGKITNIGKKDKKKFPNPVFVKLGDSEE